MKKLKIAVGLLAIFVTFPVTVYLQYQILKRVEASELMWFLFWVNVPVVILIQCVAKVVDSDD